MNFFADIILPISNMTALQLKKANVNMKKVFPVQCGIDYAEIARIASQSNTKKYDAVFMKRVQAVKGVFDLITIWKKVTQYKKAAKLLIIGDIGDDGKKVVELVKKYNLTKNIVFAGYVYDFKKKIKLLAQSKLFILPSYEENWAISVGEAMTVGLPVIAYNLEGLTSVWKNNAVWVPLGDTDGFAKKIIESNIHPKMFIHISKRAIQSVKKLDWENIANYELQIIQKNR